MDFDYSEDGKVTITMTDYISKLIKEFKISKKSKTPAPDDLFIKRDIPLLPQIKQEAIHSGVAKLLYLSTRVRPDIALAVNYLCTQVGKFDSDDEKKFNKVLEYLHASPNLGITLKTFHTLTATSTPPMASQPIDGVRPEWPSPSG
jgi:hypothetical protein